MSPNTLKVARERLELAKVKFSEAARATLRCDPGAARLSAEAIEELASARAALAAIPPKIGGEQ